MSENDNLKKDHNEDYNLYTEDIVQKRSIKYKKVIRILKLLLKVVIVIGIACFALYAVYYSLNGRFSKTTKRTVISIPKDAYPDEDAVGDGAEDSSEESEELLVIEDVVSNNEVAFERIHQTMEDTKKSIVTITAGADAENKLPTDNLVMTSGLIIEEANDSYMILTDYNAVLNAVNITVTFNDNTIASAYMINGDTETGIAIISVKARDVSLLTRENIVLATFDNSYLMNQGDPVIAAGKIMGSAVAVNYGVASSVEGGECVIDSYYSLICTNIAKSTGDYTYMFNIKGNVIGIMRNSSSNLDESIVVYGISDLKSLIENMLNGTKAIYLGISGSNVTTSIAAAYNLPVGIYIADVYENSPAFKAGIQSGDVISMIDGEPVLTLKALHDKICMHNVGDTIIFTIKRLGKGEYKPIEFSVTLGTK